MSILGQCGPRTRDTIVRGIRAGSLKGIVLSPRYESALNLSLLVRELRHGFRNSIEILLDPQFYATLIPSARVGYLQGYDYFHPELTPADFKRPASIRRFVRETLTFQTNWDLSRIISPAVLFTDFSGNDVSSFIAMQLVQDSKDFCEEEGLLDSLLVALVLDESALRTRSGLESFLDIVTGWKPKPRGFFLAIRFSDGTYPSLIEESSLTNLLYLVYVLAHLHGFELTFSHVDLPGILLHALGAHATSTGCFHSLRQFTLKPFQAASKGGGSARERYTSAPLLNSILLTPDLSAMARPEIDLSRHVLSHTSYDAILDNHEPGNAPWPPDISCLHHWEVLSRLALDVSSSSDLAMNLDSLQGLIADALNLYDIIEQAGVTLDLSAGRRNTVRWQRALQALREEVQI